MTVFAHSQTTNKLVNEAANDSARVSGQDRKKPPALGTNHIAGIGGFRPLASLEKINIYISFKDIFIRLKHISSTQNRTCLNTRETKSKDKKNILLLLSLLLLS